MATRDKSTESPPPKWRALWDRIPWARIGQIGSALGGVVAIVALVQAFTKEAPDLIARCYSVPSRASLEPLIKRDVDAQSGDAQRRRNSWIGSGYVACEIQNTGTKVAREVTIYLSQDAEVTFYDGVTLSTTKPGELKLEICALGRVRMSNSSRLVMAWS